MTDESNAGTPAATPRTPRRRRRRRPLTSAAARREIKAAAAKVDAAAVAEQTGVKPAEVAELDKVMAAAGLLHAPIPEAPVLAETPEETKAKLTKLERDQLSLAAALEREAEIQANDDGTDDAGDAFFIDRRIIPHGWHYEWRRDTVLNQRDPAYAVSLAKRGWRAVPLDRHPELMPTDWTGGNYIVRGGQILMEIPKVTHDRLRDAEKEKAFMELQNKVDQINGRGPKDRPGAQPRRGVTTRDFGPILGANESAYAGGGRTIAR